MSETEAAPEQEAVTQSVETVLANVQPEIDATAEVAEEEEFEEIELEGSRYSVPKPIKSAIMRNEDYTKKTQEIAKTAKDFEEQRKQFEEYQSSYRENAKEYAQITALDGELDKYSKVNWDLAMETDLVEANKAWIRYQGLLSERNQRAQGLEQKENERRLKVQSEMTKREEEGRAVLLREIKDFSPELESNLRQYAISQGVPAERAKAHNFAMSPAETKILHKAWQLDQLVKKQAQKPNTPVEQPKPSAKVIGGKSSTGPGEYKVGMSDAEYDRWRAKQSKK